MFVPYLNDQISLDQAGALAITPPAGPEVTTLPAGTMIKVTSFAGTSPGNVFPWIIGILAAVFVWKNLKGKK